MSQGQKQLGDVPSVKSVLKKCLQKAGQTRRVDIRRQGQSVLQVHPFRSYNGAENDLNGLATPVHLNS